MGKSEIVGQCEAMASIAEGYAAKRDALELDGDLSEQGRANALDEWLASSGYDEGIRGLADGLRGLGAQMRQGYVDEAAGRLSDASYLDHLDRLAGMVRGGLLDEFEAEALGRAYGNDPLARRIFDRAASEAEVIIPWPEGSDVDARARTLGRIESHALDLGEFRSGMMRKDPAMAALRFRGLANGIGRLDIAD